MDAMTFVLDDRVWTSEERDALPPDGSRHELLDGALIVTPSPGSLTSEWWWDFPDSCWRAAPLTSKSSSPRWR